MQIEFDSDKREITLMERGLDFARAAEVFAGVTLTVEDARRNYGEARFITVGLLDGRTVVDLDAARRCAPYYQHEESQ